MSVRRRVFLAAIAASLFIGLFLVLVFTYSFPANTPPFLAFLVTYHFEFMIAMVGMGVVAGAFVYWLMREEVQTMEKESKLNAELALSLLNPDERKAVKLLLEKNGECLQAEVSRLEGLSRLKAHRIAGSLSARGIVTLEKRGKAVFIRLAENFRQALLA